MADRKALEAQLRRLKSEARDLEKRIDAPGGATSKDEFQYDIRIGKGDKPKVKVIALTGVTISCATACGTCMKDSCYTCDS